jgi:soluble lytic murein transglycosylase-like protein
MRWFLAVASLVFVCSSSVSLKAADGISASVDSAGKVVFTNEAGEGNAGAFRAPATNSATRRVVASATADDTVDLSDKLAPDLPANGLDGNAVGRDQLDSLIEETAQLHGIDPDLIRAIVKVESNYNPYAVSPQGARGLMQLIPATAYRFGVRNAFDPRSNLEGGVRYLKYLLGLYGGNLPLSLAAYNAAEAAVSKRGGMPPYRETQNYVRKILELYPPRSVVLRPPPDPKVVKFVDSGGVVHFSNTDLP